jgi:uncharacterized protein YyaL (SSP411 family)
MREGRQPNRLAREKSPYLLKHAYNPVDWYPWSEEAIRKAKNDGKPIFLSIGYFSCHWCNVMERESFEDEETAAILNKHFIAIKVDREERPDLDAYYMSALQAMTGGGGWPMSVFLTPDLKPFYAGTYFPPEPMQGMPGFKQVLEFVAKLWKENRGEVAKNSEEVARALIAEVPPGSNPGKEILDGGFQALAASFDPTRGGFGGAPKFPLPIYLEYLLRYNFRTGNELALKMVTRTLDEIAKGGIRDHVGGGFHRYSTDRHWLVPHFEKMLYDNALLSRAFLQAYLVTRSEAYSSVAREALEWMNRELSTPDGAFYSALDADTEEGEGVYYTVTPEEVDRVLGKEAAEKFCFIYGVTKNGNFEGGRTIPSISHSLEDASVRFGVERTSLESRLREWRRLMYEERSKRPRPSTDTKVITSWNGLAISALARAGRILKDQSYLRDARAAAGIVLEKNRRGDSLFRIYAGGESSVPGMLEDYAFLSEGLLDLFEATGEPRWLEDALALAREMIALFWDDERGGFFMSSDSVPARTKDSHDGPTPSGNASAAVVLARLSEITGEKTFRDRADGTIRYFAGELELEPTAHTYLLGALDLQLNGMREVVITARDGEAAREMVERVNELYIPDCVVVVATGEKAQRLRALTPLLEGRKPGPKATAFVCQNFTCKLPAKDAATLGEQLTGRKR